MCIGLPMQVTALAPGRARVCGRGEQREVSTALVGPLAIGDWVLVFLDGAREQISAERAAEVDATLDLLAAAMQATGPGPWPASLAATDPGFPLPSALDAVGLARLLGQAEG